MSATLRVRTEAEEGDEVPPASLPKKGSSMDVPRLLQHQVPLLSAAIQSEARGTEAGASSALPLAGRASEEGDLL